MKKLFLLLTALVLSSSMSMWGSKKVTYLSEGDFKTSVYEYIGTTSSKGYPIYCYQWSDELMLYMTFKSSLAGSWTYNGNTYVMPAKGSYAVQGSSNAERAVGNNQSGWNGDTKSMIKDHEGYTEYLYTGTITVEEGADGPYIYSSNLTEIYYDSYSGRNVQDGYFEIYIGSPATYRTVSVVSNNTTMGTVSYTYKSGYVYANNRLQEFKDGSVYTLTATKRDGYRFVNWKKGTDIISEEAICDVKINGNATYTATFEQLASEATITTSVGVGGTVGGDAGKYNTNTQHTITATANPGYAFAYWEDANHNIVSNNASYTFTLMADVNYTAIFYADGTITANSNNTDWGTVTGGGSYAGNTQVTLTATPKGGYQFVEWNDHNTDATRQVVVNGNATYTATFAVETASYASFSWDDANDIIETEAYTEGALCESMFYPYGSKFIWIQAKNKARSTHNFLNLVIRTNNSRKYHNDEYDGPLVADYSVVVPTEYGPVVANCDNSIYESNYYFCQLPGNVTDKVVGWHIETMSHDGTCHFQGYFGTLSQRISMLCSFACDKTNVNSDIGENESNYTNINSAIVKVSEGKDGHMYIRIENASTGKLLITIGEPAPATHALAWDANGGELSGTYTAAGDYEEGAAITAPTATKTGYTFTGWSPAFTGTMPASDVTYVAQWELNTYTVTFKVHDNSTGFGTLQKNSETPTTEIVITGVPHNTTLTGSSNTITLLGNTITANPAEAAGGYTYAFQAWSGASSKITANKTISARFTRTATEYSITYNNYDISTYPGTVTTTYTVESSDITLLFAPNVAKEGYTFAGWYDNEELTGTPVTSIAQGSTGNKEFWAKWEQKTYTVTIAVDETNNYGTVSATSIAGVPHGATITVSDNTITINGATVTATAADADDLFTYSFSAWKNGETTLTGNSNTVTEAMTITAHFARNLKDDITLNDMEDAEYYNNFATTYDSVEVGTVTYNRTFAANRWSTICLPFDAPLVSPLKGNIFEFQHATGNANVGGGIYLYFSTATQIVAGRAYLVRFGKAPVSNSYTFYDVKINTSADKNTLDALVAANTGENANQTEGTISLIGTLRKFVLPTPSIYYMALYNNKIYYPGTNTTVPAYRAFFYDSNPSGVQQRVRIVVDGVDMGEMLIDNGELLDADKADDRAPRKYIRNGVLVIECNGVTYDAQGKRL